MNRPPPRQDEERSQVEAGPTRRQQRKGLYLLPSALTAANLGLGFYAIVSIMHGHRLMRGAEPPNLAEAGLHFETASRAIFFAILCDVLDGHIARLTKTNTEFGVQFDSIADVVSFCFAPMLLAYAWSYGALFGENGGAHALAFYVSFMYLICGAFRLARFNIQASRSHVVLEGTSKLSKNHFVGLPTPAAAALIAAVVHFTPQPLITHANRAPLFGALLMLMVGVLAILMVSTIRYPSFKSFGETKRSARLGVLLVASIIMLLWLYSRQTLLIMWSVYILNGLIRAAASMLNGLRTQQRIGHNG